MKALAKYIFALAAAAAVTVACKKENEYEWGKPDVEGCYGVYFPSQTTTGSHTLTPSDAKSVTFTVSRYETDGDITVPLVVTDPNNVYTVSPLHFNDGQTESTITVDFENAEIAKTYPLTIAIEDSQYASSYRKGAHSIDYSVFIVEMHTLKDESGENDAVVTFTVQPDFLEDFDVDEAYTKTGKIEYYEIDGVRHCKTVTDDGKGIWYSDNEIEFLWYTKLDFGDGTKDQPLEVKVQSTGYTIAVEAGGTQYPIKYADYYNFVTDLKEKEYEGASNFTQYAKTSRESEYPASYYDGMGGFYFNLAFDITGSGYWYGFHEASVAGVGSGYTRVYYGLKVSSDYSDGGKTPVFINAGESIKTVKYAIYEGKLSPAQIETKVGLIDKGTDESTSVTEFAHNEEAHTNSATLKVSPDETGEYTLVAVAYDEKGEKKSSGSTTFKHVTADDAAEYMVDLNVYTEDTPARYTAFHDYDSFAFGIYGSGLTDVRMVTVTVSDVLKFGFDKIVSTIRSDNKYAASDSLLNVINSNGGYYAVANRLRPDTPYVMIVWATNGSLDVYKYDVYMTAALPYEWELIGEGRLTDDIVCPIYGIDPITLKCDVYKEKNIPGIYMVNNYQKEFVEYFFGEDLADYGMTLDDVEGTLWEAANLVIDASDPEKVFIPEQAYGLTLSSDDGLFDVTSVIDDEHTSEGLYDDGVITFPEAGGIACVIGGDGYYQTNLNGAFKVVFPDNVGTTSIPANTKARHNFKLPRAGEFNARARRYISIEREAKPLDVKVEISATAGHKSARKIKANL